jgi:hypothetical protein
MSEYITDGEEPSGAGERTSVYLCPYYDSAFAFGFYFAIIYGRKIKQHSMVHNLRYKTMLNKSCIYI